MSRFKIALNLTCVFDSFIIEFLYNFKGNLFFKFAFKSSRKYNQVVENITVQLLIELLSSRI
jgi:hypothetical protein